MKSLEEDEEEDEMDSRLSVQGRDLQDVDTG